MTAKKHYCDCGFPQSTPPHEHSLVSEHKKELEPRWELLRIILKWLKTMRPDNSDAPSDLADAVLKWHHKDKDKLLMEIEMYREEILRLGGSLKKGKFGKVREEEDDGY